MKHLTKNTRTAKALQIVGLTLILIAVAVLPSFAQTQIQTAIDGATSQVSGIFDSVSNLVLVIGAVVGLAGAIRVYILWQQDGKEVQKHLVGWMGACIFLLLTGVILKTFFGL